VRGEGGVDVGEEAGAVFGSRREVEARPSARGGDEVSEEVDRVVEVGLDGLGVLGCKVGQDEAAVMAGLLGVHKAPDELLILWLGHRRGVRGGFEEMAVVGHIGLRASRCRDEV
jgi:hypothetical protein